MTQIGCKTKDRSSNMADASSYQYSRLYVVIDLEGASSPRTGRREAAPNEAIAASVRRADDKVPSVDFPPGILGNLSRHTTLVRMHHCCATHSPPDSGH